MTISVPTYAETVEEKQNTSVYSKTIPAKTWELAGVTDPLTGRLFPAGGYFILDNWQIFATMGGLHSNADNDGSSVKIDSFQATLGTWYTFTNETPYAPLLGGEYVFARNKKNEKHSDVDVLHIIPGIRFFMGERNAIDLLVVFGFGKVRGGTFGDDNNQSLRMQATSFLIGYSFFFGPR